MNDTFAMTKNHSLVLVTWVDAHGVTNDWEAIDDRNPMQPFRHHSTGWLLVGTATHVELAMSIGGPRGESENYNTCDGRLAIPREAILCIRSVLPSLPLDRPPQQPDHQGPTPEPGSLTQGGPPPTHPDNIGVTPAFFADAVDALRQRYGDAPLDPALGNRLIRLLGQAECAYRAAAAAETEVQTANETSESQGEIRP